MESHLEDRDRVGVADAVLLEDYTSEDAFVNNLQKRFNEDVIYVSIVKLLGKCDDKNVSYHIQHIISH